MLQAYFHVMHMSTETCASPKRHAPANVFACATVLDGGLAWCPWCPLTSEFGFFSAVSCLVLFARHFYAYAQDKSDFPDGFDAVQAAPKSHRVVFENAFVRVLEVNVLSGTTVPMHHHRWPSLLLSWDTGGKSPHVHYRRPYGSVRDIPSTTEAIHPDVWTVEWMKPEPMHAVEILEAPTPERDSGCPLAASGNNRPHRVHFQGWCRARMGFGRDGNLHVMAE